MAIDIDAARAQQRELNMVADEVAYVKRRLQRHQETLDAAWKSPEIKGMDAVIEELIRRLNRLSGELENLGHDVMVTAQEIKTEEEEALLAAEEALRMAAEN